MLSTDKCGTGHFVVGQLFDSKTKGDQSCSEGTCELSGEKEIGHRKLVGQKEQSFEKGTPVEINEYRSV